MSALISGLNLLVAIALSRIPFICFSFSLNFSMSSFSVTGMSLDFSLIEAMRLSTRFFNPAIFLLSKVTPMPKSLTSALAVTEATISFIAVVVCLIFSVDSPKLSLRDTGISLVFALIDSTSLSIRVLRAVILLLSKPTLMFTSLALAWLFMFASIAFIAAVICLMSTPANAFSM